MKGTPTFIRSDNGPEFTANRLREWLSDVNVKTAFIEPSSPWEKAIVKASTVRCVTNF